MISGRHDELLPPERYGEGDPAMKGWRRGVGVIDFYNAIEVGSALRLIIMLISHIQLYGPQLYET
jgi:hypothetical protein